MNGRKFLVFTFICALYILSGCGTGIGNPGNSTPGLQGGTDSELTQSYAFETPASGYKSLNVERDCGRFDETTPSSVVNEAEECIEDAFDRGETAKFLLEEDLGGGLFYHALIVVEVTGDEDEEKNIFNHILSNDQTRVDGEIISACPDFVTNQFEEGCGLSPIL